MSSSDSDSSDSSSSESSAGWPWRCEGIKQQSASEESDSSSEDSSAESSFEATTNDSWTNRRNIFISVYNTNNYKDATLITNYTELHSYREKYSKLSKKTPDSIKNIWNEVKVNVPDQGIVPLKTYEKELIETNKSKIAKKPTAVPDKGKSTAVAQTPSSKTTQTFVSIPVDVKTSTKTQTNGNKNTKETNTNGTVKSKENDSNVKSKTKENMSNQKKTAEAPAAKTEVNKTTLTNGSTKVDKKDKGVKGDLVVLSVTKSESDKKNTKTQTTTKSKESDKNAKNNPKEAELKKPQNNNAKSKKGKQKNSYSQSSENNEAQKRSSSVDSFASSKVKAKKKIEESDNETTDDEDEEIVDNMDALTGNAKVTNNDKMLGLVKHKETKKKPAETVKVPDKKVVQKTNNEENVAVSPMKNDINLSISEKNNVFYSEKYAEESVDMIMNNNLTGALDSIVEAMQYNPGDDRHYLNRCYCYLRMNKPALALADAQYLLQTSSHYGHRFIAYLRAGQASMALQKFSQAENYFRDSLSINSDNLYAQREYMRAKISKIVSLGYTERNAVLALLKHSKTQEAIGYLANKNVAKNDISNDYKYDDVDDDLVYSSDVDEKPNCTTLINNNMNFEPIKTKLFHLIAKPVNLIINPTTNKNSNADNKKKSTTTSKASTGKVMERAIWVGSLTRSIDEAALKRYFKQFGTIASIYCPPNEAYAFVNFEKTDGTANVLKKPSHEINGVKVSVRQGVHKK